MLSRRRESAPHFFFLVNIIGHLCTSRYKGGNAEAKPLLGAGGHAVEVLLMHHGEEVGGLQWSPVPVGWPEGLGPSW